MIDLFSSQISRLFVITYYSFTIYEEQLNEQISKEHEPRAHLIFKLDR